MIIFKMIMKFNRHLKESKSHENRDVIYEVNKCVGNPYFRSYLNYFGE